ncbi:MAG: energy transducer TonB [Bacteroidales bacterium]|jgi:TonB family protein|nr:energy transducer TonB [Bacteroidales bacterium]
MVRKYITLFFLLLLANVVYCQIDGNDSLLSKCDVYNNLDPFRCFYPEEYPIFDKNYPQKTFEKLYEFFIENVKYPETAKADKLEGQVFVQFWIDSNGFTYEHKIIRSVRQDLDEEALRIAKLIKYDIPAKNRGKPVGLCSALLFIFTLNENDSSWNPLQSEKDKPVRKRKSNGRSGSSEVIDNKKRNNGL